MTGSERGGTRTRTGWRPAGRPSTACECDPSWTAGRWSHCVHLDHGGQRKKRGFQYYGTDQQDICSSPDDTNIMKNNLNMTTGGCNTSYILYIFPCYSTLEKYINFNIYKTLILFTATAPVGQGTFRLNKKQIAALHYFTYCRWSHTALTTV